MTARPAIGVTASVYKSRIGRFFDWLAVRRAGAVPVTITPAAPEVERDLDGLIIGGGDDIGAHLYGGEPAIDIRVDPDRDALELALLERFAATGCPVLGICRGAQMINVFRGGSLFADAYEAHGGARNRRTPLPYKTVDIAPESRIGAILGIRRCRVNSLHHQSVDRLGRDLAVVGRDRNGIVQAIEDARHPFLIGVQWHPEFLVFNRPQQRLFARLVAAARAFAAAGRAPAS